MVTLEKMVMVKCTLFLWAVLITVSEKRGRIKGVKLGQSSGHTVQSIPFFFC